MAQVTHCGAGVQDECGSRGGHTLYARVCEQGACKGFPCVQWWHAVKEVTHAHIDGPSYRPHVRLDGPRIVHVRLDGPRIVHVRLDGPRIVHVRLDGPRIVHVRFWLRVLTMNGYLCTQKRTHTHLKAHSWCLAVSPRTHNYCAHGGHSRRTRSRWERVGGRRDDAHWPSSS